MPSSARSPHFEFSGSWSAGPSRFLRRPHTWATPPAAISRIGPTRARVTAGFCETLNASPSVIENTLEPNTLLSPRPLEARRDHPTVSQSRPPMWQLFRLQDGTLNRLPKLPVNRRPNLTPDRRPILTLLGDEFWR